MANRPPVGWPGALLALLTAHLVGDFLLQTEWQAVNKTDGLRTSRSRRALFAHVVAYTAAFSPALAWIGKRTSARRALIVGGAVAIPHVLVDDGRLVEVWLREVKRVPDPSTQLAVAVDQSFHMVCLLGAAVLAAS